MTDSELARAVGTARGEIERLSKAGVANATSTTEVASCPPTLTACSPHFTCWWTICFCLAPANEGEREVAAAMLEKARRDGLLTGGEIIITDKGFAGEEFEEIIASLDARLIRPDRKD